MRVRASGEGHRRAAEGRLSRRLRGKRARSLTLATHQHVQRCQIHKVRNVTSHLPKERHAHVKQVMRRADKSPEPGDGQTPAPEPRSRPPEQAPRRGRVAARGPRRDSP